MESNTIRCPMLSSAYEGMPYKNHVVWVGGQEYVTDDEGCVTILNVIQPNTTNYNEKN